MSSFPSESIGSNLEPIDSEANRVEKALYLTDLTPNSIKFDPCSLGFTSHPTGYEPKPLGFGVNPLKMPLFYAR